MELAFRMQTEAPRLMDLSGESSATKALYGVGEPKTDDFGRACLLARRFAEAGVRYITVMHSTRQFGNLWDQHKDLYDGHRNNAAAVDLPIAGLLRDLKSRGMLDDTLVMCGSEFGRTPVFEFQDGNEGRLRNGRDHNPHGFTMWFAGGGTKGGFSYGETDDYGFHAVKDRVSVHDLHATILYALGLDHEKLTYRHGGRDHRLTDVYGSVVRQIFA
jgi:arylsulfatase A-like enzyme